MNPLLLVHGYSAESKSSTPSAIQGIYGTLPAALREKYGPRNVFELDVSRYISLEDGIRLDDISRAMENALRADFGHLLEGKFDVVIHSTGALVVRNWLRNHSRKPSPIDRLVYLAGANFGSGWAHVGKGQLAKWGRFVFQGGAERGVQVLNSLELGSPETLDLHIHFLEPGNGVLSDYKVKEFCLIGSQAKRAWLRFPVRYAHEDGSDGVVRVAGCNVNFNYLPIQPKRRTADLGWDALKKQVALVARPPEMRTSVPDELYTLNNPVLADEADESGVPLAILFECAHSGDDMGIVRGRQPREALMELLDVALKTRTVAQYRQAAKHFAEHTAETYRRAESELAPGWLSGLFHEPRQQYDAHAQIVFRMRDQDGRPIDHFDLFFHSGTSDKAKWTASRPDQKTIKELFEHTHVSSQTGGVILFYLRVTSFDEDSGTWKDRLADIDGVDLEIVATEPQTGDIAYLPCRLVISADRLRRIVRPHQTTIVDITMPRHPSGQVFKAVEVDG